MLRLWTNLEISISDSKKWYNIIVLGNIGGGVTRKLGYILLIILLGISVGCSRNIPNDIQKTVNNTNTSKDILNEAYNIKFEYFYRGFETVKNNMMSTYPQGTLIIETDADWHDFMDKYVPGISYNVTVDFSKEYLIYNGSFPAKSTYSTGFDIKGFTISENKLNAESVMSDIYAQNIDEVTHCFVNIVKVNKNDIPQSIENIYHIK